eukprot:TRINITY_DN8361_c0_g1_i1.p1 TRINITY_DN8361_c0_g1~~TRINITY_DN8361_c0_g1_i1.p1  ORF type:complete len:388 (-),score=73.08 TRINITY_DN8361_c0_g1_i1:45-1067(-)
MRIPYGRNGSQTIGNKPAVYLQHGLLDSAAAWVINNPHESLGFILADEGFDVFLGNVRGNTWSTNNTKYNIDSDAYWNLVDFDNMISIDLPTMIDAVLKKSGQKQLVYIGHSQGTLMGFAGFSSYPHLASKVSIFLALAPVAFVNHQTSYFLTVLSDLHAAFWVEFFGWRDFLPSAPIIDFLAGLFCEEEPLTCTNFIFLLCGSDPSNLNQTRLPLYVSYTPAGTSVRNMMHWSQMVRSGRFQKYDYGLENYYYYGQFEPPQYYPENMTHPPVAFFTGTQDDLADPVDVANLIDILPASNKPVKHLNIEVYQHLDFTWGEDAWKLLYPTVIDLAKKYSSQ